MTPSTIYIFNLYSNLCGLNIVALTLLGIMIGVFVLITLVHNDLDIEEETVKKFTKYIKGGVVAFILCSLFAFFAPSPKALAVMYGVDYLNKLNTSVEVSGSQIYKDITTIIHNYAVEKENK